LLGHEQVAADQVIAAQTHANIRPAYPLIIGPHTYASGGPYKTSVDALAYHGDEIKVLATFGTTNDPKITG